VHGASDIEEATFTFGVRFSLDWVRRIDEQILRIHRRIQDLRLAAVDESHRDVACLDGDGRRPAYLDAHGRGVALQRVDAEDLEALWTAPHLHCGNARQRGRRERGQLSRAESDAGAQWHGPRRNQAGAQVDRERDGSVFDA
jgi:hypothetical protein